MAIRTHLSGRYADLRGSGMKLTRVCFFGKYSIRGVFITTHVHFSLSPIPRLHLWLGHYSCPFPVQLQRGLPEQFRTGAPCRPRGGPVLLQRDVPEQFQVASKAAPEGASRAVPEAWVQCCSRGGPELLQRGGSRAAPDAGSSAAPEGGSSAAPEGVQCCSRGAGAPWAPNGQHRCRSSVSIAQGVCFDTGN